MSRFKTIAFTTLASLAVYATVLYTSCNKDNCQGVTCFNNSTCENGACKCQPGFSGTSCTIRANTNIVYQNNTQVEVQISATTSTGTFGNVIMPGSSFTVTGGFATEAIANISSFNSGSGGDQLTWNLIDSFPSAGVTIVPINAPASYFFLRVINNTTQYYVDKVVVNYNLSTQETLTGQDIYYGGTSYPVGYFHAQPNSNVYLYSTSYSQVWSFTSLSLPDTVNQVFTAIIN